MGVAFFSAGKNSPSIIVFLGDGAAALLDRRQGAAVPAGA
jgi:hypothetical protein